MKEEDRFVFNIDRGGTFTDFYIQDIRCNAIIKETIFKVLSQGREGEGPVVGIRKYLVQKGLMDPSNPKIPTDHI